MPGLPPARRDQDLKDGGLPARYRAGSLPSVVFKPVGRFNQHPSYTDLLSGDEHITDISTGCAARRSGRGCW